MNYYTVFAAVSFGKSIIKKRKENINIDFYISTRICILCINYNIIIGIIS